jgi:hypothetical protein
VICYIYDASYTITQTGQTVHAGGETPRGENTTMEPTQTPGPDQIEIEIQGALSDASLPRFYLNGFSTTLGSSDVLVVLKQNNKPIALVNMSYTIAKSLSEKLANSISILEKLTGNTIMTTDDIQKKVRGAEDE